MRMRDVRLLLVAVAFGAAGPASADAAFSSEEDFLRAVGDTSFESFEELTAEDAINQKGIRATGFTVETDRAEMGIFSSKVTGLHATDGSKHLVWDAFPSEISFVFASPITAFGVTLNDALDQGANPSLSLTTNGGADFPDLLVGPLTDADERFVGITTDAPFTQLTIRHNARDSVGFDEVRFAPIPAPQDPPSPPLEPEGTEGARADPAEQ